MGGAGGGRVARVLRPLLLVVLVLAAVEYLFGFILDASSFRTYLYTPLYNATYTNLNSAERPASTWPRFVPISISFFENNTTQVRNSTRRDVPKVSSLFITKILDGIKNLVKTEVSVTKTDPPPVTLPLCDSMPPDLGPINVDKKFEDLDFMESKYPELMWGGRYTPPNCTARHKVAIIVPYRNRKRHLAIFLNHIHPFLMKQQIQYGIFITEQAGHKSFNRAKLMNVGFMETQRLEPGGWQCFIFHDIDLLPLDTRNLYSCPKQPRHMSASIDKHDFALPYEHIFGGVSAMTLEQFTKVNGFSNKYWGWGGEDDDMSHRLQKLYFHIGRYKMSIARYVMLDHEKAKPNPKRYYFLSQTDSLYWRDGLSSLKYELIHVMQFHLYTHILVNINQKDGT